jgi:ribonucleotide reductase alpha subunit
MTETVSGAPRGGGTRRKTGLRLQRVYTRPGVHPYDEVDWVRRDVVMTNWRDGTVNFEQRGVEFPEFWSVNAVNIVTTKYFRGAVGTEQREWSLKQLIDRVVKTYVAAGLEYGYFATPEDAEIFDHELTHMLVHQIFSFNSPVWFNVGTPAPQQVSACQPYDALVSTPDGLIPIGRLVEQSAVGVKVFDAQGLTQILAVKANGEKEVLRIQTKSGHSLDVTADHLVWRSSGNGSGRFVPAGDLRPGDQLEWHRTYSHGSKEISSKEMAEAALAGWLQSDRFVGRDAGTNRSVTIEAMTGSQSELDWVTRALDVVFPDVHRHERAVATKRRDLDCRRTWLYGRGLAEFVERWDLMTPGPQMRVPDHLYDAPLPVVTAYLRSLFQTAGYVSGRASSTQVGLDMISEDLVRGLQALLSRFGIFARVGRKLDRDRHPLWELRIQPRGERLTFAQEIGFIDQVKSAKLEASFDQDGSPSGETELLEIARVASRGVCPVYDIQTESGEYLSAGLRVHNCFILAVEDTMDSILNWYREEGLIFKGGSGAGVNLSRIRSSKELLSSGGTASGPVSFMRGADASAGTIKSGGATRRAAKMVVLDVDHPDIEEFVETKAREERKIRVLRDAGFDMDLGGQDIISVQYQNANNSVRVSDEFMHAVDDGRPFDLRARLDGSTVQTVDARTLFRKIGEAAWECADPGIQYDDTINDWHTCPETGRITASNPCFPAEQRVATDRGLVPIGDLVRRVADGESFAVYTNDVTSADRPRDRVFATAPTRYLFTGVHDVVELRFSDGSLLRCTPNHRLWTRNRGWVPAGELTDGDDVVRSLHRVDRWMADRALPAAVLDAAAGLVPGELTKWDEEIGHFLGWFAAAGEIHGDRVVVRYRPTDALAADRHAALLRRLTGSEPGRTATELQLINAGLTAVLTAFGSGPAGGVPHPVFEAPDDAVNAFVRGLYEAGARLDESSACVNVFFPVEQSALDVQELLGSLGVASRMEATVEGWTVRSCGRWARRLAATVALTVPRGWLAGSPDPDPQDGTIRLVTRTDVGRQRTYNLTEPRNHSYVVGGIVVSNCSEYVHLDNSSCNLASMNLMKFLRDDGTFDAQRFAKAVELVITAMDISICFADFPTETIAETTRDYRQLGIGYANLGAMLMATGHAYDSDGGRALAAAITSLMTGTAYKRSAELAGIVGPYAGYQRNTEAHTRVMRKHAAACDAVRPLAADTARILHEATRAWQDALRIGERNGWRNAQASVLAPTGTIGLMMDCDTTGVEPDLALVKMKKLVGGASMQIVNTTVPRALETLGYQEEQVEAIVEHISEHGNVIDAPGLRPEHYEVFDCAMGPRAIGPMGHVRMMAAVQPFISGAISKTVNLPESATVEDVQKMYFEGWKLGLKALAIYRDNCKVGQPLSDATAGKAVAAAAVAEQRPVRRRLPKTRPSKTVSFSVGGAEGYMTASSYPDDGLGEVFLKMSKQGSTLAGVMDAFSIAISIALQYGVPLEAYVSKFINMRFDPAGMTDDPDVRMAQSVMDYIFRRLALEFLPYERRAELGVFTADERAAAVASAAYGGTVAPADEPEVDVETLRSSAPREAAPTESGPATTSTVPDTGRVGHGEEFVTQTAVDAPLCFTCGIKMRPAGSCYVCESCGSTSGCS